MKGETTISVTVDAADASEVRDEILAMLERVGIMAEVR